MHLCYTKKLDLKLRMLKEFDKSIFGGKYMIEVHPKDRNIAMVFQSYALYPHLSVYENISLGLKVRKIPKCEIDRRVKRAAEILKLEEYLERKPKELSG